MKNVSDLLTRLEAQSSQELALFEAQTRSALTNWCESLAHSLNTSLGTIEADMAHWTAAAHASQIKHQAWMERRLNQMRQHLRQQAWTVSLALATGLVLGGILGMMEIARAIRPPTNAMINGRAYVLIDSTAQTFAGPRPNTFWVAVAP